MRDPSTIGFEAMGRHKVRHYFRKRDYRLASIDYRLSTTELQPHQHHRRGLPRALLNRRGVESKLLLVLRLLSAHLLVGLEVDDDPRARFLEGKIHYALHERTIRALKTDRHFPTAAVT